MDFQKWVKENRHYLRKKWTQKVLAPKENFHKRKGEKL